MIKLVDFLKVLEIPLNRENYKVHLAITSGSSPIEAFFKNEFRNWQEIQTKKNFECDMIIGLITYGPDKWLFAGIYKVIGGAPEGDHYKYITELIPGQDDIIGRLIIHHKRKARASYLWGANIEDQFTLSEVLPKRLTIGKFPGNNAVRIMYSELKIIIEQNEPTWFGALSNINGVYLITDTFNGKHYVGSAKGSEGIWQRWADYASDGHGGNKELKTILEEKGSEHKTHFQYSILEIADMQTPEELILKRESYWKDLLKSIEFGYNSN